MSSNEGFRIGLLLDHFFSDRRKKCYFFINTKKIQLISELKETFIEKFGLPPSIQLIHNNFLLLEEDTVFVLRQDEIIEIVKAEECGEKSVKKKRKIKNVETHETEQLLSSTESETREEEYFPSKNKKSRKSKHRHTGNKTNNQFDENQSYSETVCENTLEVTQKVKKTINNYNLIEYLGEHKKSTKKDSRVSSFTKVESENEDIENSKLTDDSVLMNDSLENSNPKKKRKKRKKLEDNEKSGQVLDVSCNSFEASNIRLTPSISSCNLDINGTELSKPWLRDGVNKIECPGALNEKLNVQSEVDSEMKELEALNKNNLKRKIKNEQNKLKYSGVAELIKQIQNNNDNSTIINDGTEEQINESQTPGKKRKRVRKHRKRKAKSNNNSLNEVEDELPEKEAVIVKSEKKFSNFNTNPKKNVAIHKRFDIEESELKTTNDQEELNCSVEVVCNEISPLTPPSEHNSEDDVYKKLLDLKKINGPVAFERKRLLVENEGNESRNEVVLEGTTNFGKSHISILKSEEGSMDQSDDFSDLQKVSSDSLLNVSMNSSDEDKNKTVNCIENRECVQDFSNKSDSNHFKKNIISEINLEKIDINNYPVIQSTRKNDILVFKTLKLSANFSPTISCLILARVLEVSDENIILFDILSGKEELEHMKNIPLDEDNKPHESLISLNWNQLYEPRLLYP